jgi:peptide/nickel transport system permease protein
MTSLSDRAMVTADVGQSKGEASPPRQRRAKSASFWRRYRRSVGSVVGLAVLVVYALVSVFPSLFATYDPDQQDIFHRNLGLGAPGHWLGTDSLGRDLYSRLIFGVHVTLGAALLAVAVAVVIGVPAGLIAGYKGGKIDQLFNAISDGTMSIPAILAVVAVIAALGPDLTKAMITVGIFLAPRMFRVQRGSTISICHETYIEASRAIGCRTPRLLFRHILPNALSPTIVQATLIFGAGVLSESALSFVGLGVQKPQSSLGSLIADAAPQINQYPFMIVAPGVATALCVLSFALVGEGLKDSLGGRVPTK